MGELLDRLHRNLGTQIESNEEKPRTWDDEWLIKPEDIKSDQQFNDITNEIKSRIGIVDAYRSWCGKMEPKGSDKRTESIMVSCPNPAHPDANPSAWLNSDKDVGNCATCGGFDAFDIWAWNNGFNVPNYRSSEFTKVVEGIALELGMEIRRSGGITYIHEESEDEDGDAPAPADEPSSDDTAIEPLKLAEVAPIGVEEEKLLSDSPPIEWRKLLGDDSTFLLAWMKQCCGDDLPEEFYFWLGLTALGSALGNSVQLSDFTPVRGNLMICLVGPSGMGKSRSTKVMKRLLKETFPWDPSLGGVKMVAEPASGEALVREFNCPQHDPTNPSVVIGYTPVRGMVQIDELAALTERSSRLGSTLKTSMMQMFDTDEEVGSVSITGGSNTARDHFLQVVATTQPRLVSSLLSNRDAMSGFVNRWVFITGKPKKMVAWGGYSANITTLVPLLKDVRVWGGNKRIGLDADAQRIWADFFHDALVPLKLDEDSPSFGRIDLLFKKLMLLFAADQKKQTVDARIMNQVLSLWPYLRYVYQFVGERTEISDDIRSQKELEQKLLTIARLHRNQTGKDPSFRDIYSRMGRKDRNGNARKSYMDAIKVLIQTGELEEWPDRKNGAGRPTIRYAVTIPKNEVIEL